MIGLVILLLAMTAAVITIASVAKMMKIMIVIKPDNSFLKMSSGITIPTFQFVEGTVDTISNLCLPS